MTGRHTHNHGGALPRASQRRMNAGPKVLSAAVRLQPGDRVKWGTHYRGLVVEMVGESEALVSETDSPMGGTRHWRLELSALSRIPD